MSKLKKPNCETLCSGSQIGGVVPQEQPPLALGRGLLHRHSQQAALQVTLQQERLWEPWAE